MYIEIQRDRTYTGEHSLPRPLSNKGIDDGLSKYQGPCYLEDLEYIIKSIDNDYVNNKINSYNEKMNESRS